VLAKVNFSQDANCQEAPGEGRCVQLSEMKGIDEKRKEKLQKRFEIFMRREGMLRVKSIQLEKIADSKPSGEGGRVLGKRYSITAYQHKSGAVPVPKVKLGERKWVKTWHIPDNVVVSALAFNRGGRRGNSNLQNGAATRKSSENTPAHTGGEGNHPSVPQIKRKNQRGGVGESQESKYTQNSNRVWA